jgi:hypothetical protein
MTTDNSPKGKAGKANKQGRKKAVIPWGKVDTYLKAQCDGAAIAGLLGLHPDTLYNACKRDKKMVFSAYLQLKRAEGRELLRASMYTDALAGNTTMKIWLSKQYLDMTDRNDHTTGGNQIQVTPITFKPQSGE